VVDVPLHVHDMTACASDGHHVRADNQTFSLGNMGKDSRDQSLLRKGLLLSLAPRILPRFWGRTRTGVCTDFSNAILTPQIPTPEHPTLPTDSP